MVKGIVSAKGALFVHLSLFNNIINFLILFFIPPAFLGGTCFNAHSNCIDSILVGNPLTMQMCVQPFPLPVVYFAPPRISPLWARNLFLTLFETPT